MTLEHMDLVGRGGPTRSGSSPRLALMILARFSNGDGITYVSRRVLAQHLCLSRSQFYAVMQQLLDQGWIAKTRVEGRHGWRLNLAQLEHAAAVRGPVGRTEKSGGPDKKVRWAGHSRKEER